MLILRTAALSVFLMIASSVFADEEQFKKRIYAHLLIADRNSAVEEGGSRP